MKTSIAAFGMESNKFLVGEERDTEMKDESFTNSIELGVAPSTTSSSQPPLPRTIQTTAFAMMANQINSPNVVGIGSAVGGLANETDERKERVRISTCKIVELTPHNEYIPSC